LTFDDDTVETPSSDGWTALLDAKTKQQVAKAQHVKLLDGYRGKGLDFNGQTSKIHTNVPLMEVKTIAFWLNVRSFDEPFTLLNYFGDKGFGIKCGNDTNRQLTFVWSSQEKWDFRRFDHQLQGPMAPRGIFV
jgi:hypothetical protein